MGVATLKHAHVWAFFPVFLSVEIQAPHWGGRAVYLLLFFLLPLHLILFTASSQMLYSTHFPLRLLKLARRWMLVSCMLGIVVHTNNSGPCGSETRNIVRVPAARDILTESGSNNRNNNTTQNEYVTKKQEEKTKKALWGGVTSFQHPLGTQSPEDGLILCFQ